VGADSFVGYVLVGQQGYGKSVICIALYEFVHAGVSAMFIVQSRLPDLLICKLGY